MTKRDDARLVFLTALILTCVVIVSPMPVTWSERLFDCFLAFLMGAACVVLFRKWRKTDG